MKILIVGGTSSVGKALKPALSQFSEVITAGRYDCDLTLDLSGSIESMTLPDNLDVIIHTAANFGGKTDKEIFDAENVNVLGTLKLCQAAVRTKTKLFIFISSIFSSLDPKSNHFNIYTVSKKHAEEIIQLFCSINNLPYSILKPSQLYGNEESFRKHQPFFYTIIDKAEKSENIIFYGSNDARRNYLHIDDLVQIIVQVIKKNIEGIFSCAHPADITYSQIANAALNAFNNKAEIIFLKDKPNIPDNIFEKDDSLYDRINFHPQISIDDGMKKLANYRQLQK